MIYVTYESNRIAFFKALNLSCICSSSTCSSTCCSASKVTEPSWLPCSATTSASLRFARLQLLRMMRMRPANSRFT